MSTYLCGGINGLSDSECRDWREYAKKHLRTATLDPMRRDYRGKEDESIEKIVTGDLEDIAQSRYVLVNATRPSWGTAMEIIYAYQAKKCIVAWTGDGPVSPWLKYHTTFVCASLAQAVTMINEMEYQCVSGLA